jgi:glucokinase
VSASIIFAGDVGGTKTDLALYRVGPDGALTTVREVSVASRNYPRLELCFAELLGKGPERPVAAAIGIAGPVLDGVVVTTNLPWRVETRSVAAALGCEKVKLLNDLEAAAWGALHLPDSAFEVLNPGVARDASRAIIAAGTGLGQGLLFWDGGRYHPAGTEGGHVDFGPRSEVEVELLEFLSARFGHVSYERLVSGPGLRSIFDFLVEVHHREPEAGVLDRMRYGDPSAVIGEAALAGSCLTCGEAVDLFASIYGAQAGNLALTTMAFGGVYLGGGITAKLLPRLQAGGFMRAFAAKGRYEKLMKEIPVWAITDPKAGLAGAAHAAAGLL